MPIWRQLHAPSVVPELPKERRCGADGKRRGVSPLNLRSGLADAGEIAMQVPLPETADELCAVARDLRVDDRTIRLGARATRPRSRRSERGGELAKYRIVHFATHGALAGQIGGNPSRADPDAADKATRSDDGYLRHPRLQPSSSMPIG